MSIDNSTFYLYVGLLITATIIIISSFCLKIDEYFTKRMRVFSSLILISVVIHLTLFIPKELSWFSALLCFIYGASLYLLCNIDEF